MSKFVRGFAAGFVAGIAALGALFTSAELHDRAVRRQQAAELAKLDQVAQQYRSVPKIGTARADRTYPNYGESEFR